MHGFMTRTVAAPGCEAIIQLDVRVLYDCLQRQDPSWTILASGVQM